MNNTFAGWPHVAQLLREMVDASRIKLTAGQQAALLAIAERIERHGVILADEVGMGKTRIAAAVAQCVIAAGGRVAVLIPGGLAANWREELQTCGINPGAPLLSLRQFIAAWHPDSNATPWFEQPCLMISHAMAVWRLGSNSPEKRWGLLPALVHRWQHKNDCPDLSTPELWHAARLICKAIKSLPATHPAKKQIARLVKQADWDSLLLDECYSAHYEQRHQLATSVGLGLGTFELVIVDEAHKSRGADSSLNRLLEEVIQPGSEARRLAISATPIELNSRQWQQMLGRIKVNAETMLPAINEYQSAVAQVRTDYANSEVQQRYYQASAAFEQALSPYLLRRDKREDESVQKFLQHGSPIYRRKQEIEVDTFSLPMNWKQAVCAAEALSFVNRLHENSRAKRVRLTFSNGHGVSALLNQPEDAALEDHDEERQQADDSADTGVMTGKRQQRAAWWQQQLSAAMLADNDGSLFNHPAILATVEAAERVCADGEKVLVFGRYTQPMATLVQLLNARAMLRTLKTRGEYWPQAKVHNEEWSAIQHASRQLYHCEVNRGDIEAQLSAQYKSLEKQRREFRRHLLALLKQGLANSTDHGVQALFAVFEQSVNLNPQHHDLASVANALYTLTGSAEQRRSPAHLAAAFGDLVNSARNRDQFDAVESDEDESQVAVQQWQRVLEIIHQEYSRRESGYARLMDGNTSPATRNLLNLAFNRQHSHPCVLVAQSRVAREGLNLHLACRTVIMLHLEWNPGVVEQQIGRVDRLNSLWQNMLDEALAAGKRGEALPTINFSPVIFKGTYDEHHWHILCQRWDNLRAQLHGNPFPLSVQPSDAGCRASMQSILDAAPNFSPLRRGKAGTDDVS